jgi:hypothetical protein
MNWTRTKPTVLSKAIGTNETKKTCGMMNRRSAMVGTGQWYERRRRRRIRSCGTMSAGVSRLILEDEQYDEDYRSAMVGRTIEGDALLEGSLNEEVKTGTTK